MRLSIGETAKLTGVSVRTLHYYDEIGLLRPSEKAESGYRYYDGRALSVLQQILFFRELEVPLKEIREMLSRPDFDSAQALRRHRELLCMKKQRLERLIGLVEDMMRGKTTMNFDTFSTEEIERAKRLYKEEAKERWGDTEAYQESERRSASYSQADWSEALQEMDGLVKEFADGALKGLAPEDPTVQGLVTRWQAHISGRYYPCTGEILAGLGKMYSADQRFTQFLDRHAQGTARYISEAIRIYCREKG